MQVGCVACAAEQAAQLLHSTRLPHAQQQEALRAVLEHLAQADYAQSNPEMLRGVWHIILGYLGGEDPYRQVKIDHNRAMMKLLPGLAAQVAASQDPFRAAIKAAAIGNMIDCAAWRSVDLAQVRVLLKHLDDFRLALDDTPALRDALAQGSRLLYLGDNSGEICLDKLLISVIRQAYPHLSVHFGVRGRPVLNDATCEDADMVGMGEVAEVIHNGDGSPGTVLSRVRPAFQGVMDRADVVIAKGQGNYESLAGFKRGRCFYLFMAKCRPVAEWLRLPLMSLACLRG